MERNWKQLVAVFLLGFMMPGIAIRIGSMLVHVPNTAQTQPSETINITVPSQPAHSEEVFIPVLTDSGTVQVMELESYLLGVLLGEVPASFEMEALKAQAVVARTYTLYCTDAMDRHMGAAVCTDSTCCQSYYSEQDYITAGGLQEEVEKIRAAIAETKNQILTFEGSLIMATYFSCSGGRTEDAVAVWGTDMPYLQSVESPGEEQAKVFTKTVYYTSEEFASLLGRTLVGDPHSWIGPATYTNGGGVALMAVAGRSYTGTELRKLLSLNSTAFTMTADNGGIWITTTGKGHRVGMSQYGADAMAVSGSSYTQILAHYYPGTRIDKMGAIR
ncbi:MAG: stage II sporulation protein D [Ruminococcaceae bacterium]|nr:stage II sporulation protein D [Oscillospiraceae bacterium]